MGDEKIHNRLLRFLVHPVVVIIMWLLMATVAGISIYQDSVIKKQHDAIVFLYYYCGYEEN